MFNYHNGVCSNGCVSNVGIQLTVIPEQKKCRQLMFCLFCFVAIVFNFEGVLLPKCCEVILNIFFAWFCTF